MKRAFPVLVVALVALRLPSLVQPTGNDQGLYAYVGQAITRGEVPYRDAWDQKPPAVHFTYALMYAVWPHDSVVPAADLLAACVGALLLVLLGRRLTGDRGPGELAAVVFLLLGNPSFLRLGGMWVRAQCETFIAVLAAAALLLVAYGIPRRLEPPRPRPLLLCGAGLLLGLAVLFKYNAATYLGAAAITVVLLREPGTGSHRAHGILAPLAWLVAGFALPIGLAAAYFARAGALADLFHATVTYNVTYSGETYGSHLGAIQYLLTFPVRHALRENDSLWLLGGAGAVVLLLSAARDRSRIIAPVWIAAACLAITINGGRGLPQYFIQANVLLALAAGTAGALAWRAFALVGRLVLVALVVIGVARVSQFDNVARSTWMDFQYWRGAVPRAEYLARFSNNRSSALAIANLGDYLKARTAPSDRIFIFGFSGVAYVHAGRSSASRFFWSRPILAGFNEGIAGYGVSALLDDLTRRAPAFVVLQQHDWPAEGIDSASFFMQQPRLADWLQGRYELASQDDSYRIWRRRSGV